MEAKQQSASEESATKPIEEIYLLEADYGTLPAEHPALQLVQKRLEALLPEIPPEEKPGISVLMSEGQGINAMAGANWKIVVTPELIKSIKYQEELDYVLLHEMNHLLEGDIDLANKPHIQQSFFKSLGAARAAEYRADILAFNQAAELKRQTNPMGAIVFLERLRSLERGDQWEPVHGKLTDRIINLKSVTGMLEMDHAMQNPYLHRLTQPLTLIDEQVSSSLENLKKGGDISKLLATPPNDAKSWIRWRGEVKKVLEAGSLKLLIATIPQLAQTSAVYHQRAEALSGSKATNGISTTEIRRDGYQEVLSAALNRWEFLMDHKYADLEAGDRELLKTSAAEISLRLPVIATAENNQKASDQPQAIRYLHSLPFSKRLRNNFEKTIVESGQKSLSRPAELLKQLEFPGEKGEAYKFCASLSKVALRDYAIFDTESGIDTDAYLEQSALLLSAAKEYEKIHSFYSTDSETATNCDQAWSEIGGFGAYFAADVDALSSSYSSDWQQISAEQELNIDGKSLAQTLKKYESVSLTAADQARENLSGLINEEIVYGAKIPVSEYQKNLQEISELASLPDQVTDSEAYDRLIALMHRLPEQITVEDYYALFPEPNISRVTDKVTFSRNDFITAYYYKILSKRTRSTETALSSEFTKKKILLVVEGLKASISDYDTYRRAWLEEGIPSTIERSNDLDLKDLNEIMQAATTPSLDLKVKSAFTLPAEKPDLSRPHAWRMAALECLENEAEKVVDSNQFRQRVADYLSSWSTSQQDILDREPSDNSILEKLYSSDNLLSMTERDRQEYLLQCSFFVSDVVIRKRVQEFATLELIQDSSFDETFELLTTKYRSREPLESIPVINALEEKAKTPAQIERISTLITDSFRGDDETYSQAGQMVVGDSILDKYLKSKDSVATLRALLATGQDESLLLEKVGKGWSIANKQALNNYFTNIEDSQSIAELREASQLSLEDVENRFKNNIIDFRYRPASFYRDVIYRLSLVERYAALRKLLTGPGGALNDEEQREELLESFLDTHLDSTKEEQAVGVLKSVSSKIFKVAPSDELALVLSPILQPRIANPPEQPGSWRPVAQKIVHDSLRNESPEYKLIEEVRKKKKIAGSAKKEAKKFLVHNAAKGLETMLSGAYEEYEQQKPAEDRLFEFVPEEKRNREQKLSAVDLTIDMTQKFGAPGVRFLQLMGQTYPSSEEQKMKLDQIYDDVKGQSKLSAWQTLKNVTPSVASEVEELRDRIGGGSLFTVYEMIQKNGDRRVARVLNPNAWYHAQKFTSVMRQALNELADEDPRYAPAGPVVDQIEEWIQNELADESFADDDARFREQWHDWKPNRKFNARVIVPKSEFTGTNKVQIEEFIDGHNLTKLAEFDSEEQRELVALAAQHYVAQIRGSMTKKESLVHSDISAGNLRRTTEGNLAILDRGMYLHFDRSERLLLSKLANSSSSQRADTIVAWLSNLPQNSEIQKTVNAKELKAAILQQGGSTTESLDDSALQSLVAARTLGYRIPLKYSLLFKNLNALQKLSKSAGFKSLNEAVAYRPARQNSLNK